MRAIIAIPFLILFVLFALSNTDQVRLALWPTDYSLQLPLSIAILGAMGLAFLIGSLLVWFSVLGAWRRARRAEQAVRTLQDQLRVMRATPVASLPPPH
jgi:uncharacterized integral membrane protein